MQEASKAMDVLERALVQYASASAGIIAGAVVGMAIIVGTAPMFNTFFALLFSQYGLAVICVLSVVGGLQLALFVGALRELAKRDSAYVAARNAEDARATAQLQADSVMALRDALARFGNDANDISVAMIKEGPHMLATVATNAGLKRILEAHERALRPGEVDAPRRAPASRENWIETAIEANSSRQSSRPPSRPPSQAGSAPPSPSQARPARSPPRRDFTVEPLPEEDGSHAE